MMLFFFFSSRRRHTRYIGDWSSDVALPICRRALLAGHDPQLEAAVAAIEPRSARDVLTPTPPHALAAAIAGDATRAEGLTKASDATKTNGGTKSSAEGAKKDASGAGVDPQVEPVIEKFVEAVGGRAAFERLSSRVSKGTFEGTFGGVKVSGAVELLEKSPDKTAALISVPGIGVIRRAYTGLYGYQQIPLFGFEQIEGNELADMKLSAEFNWFVKLKQLYPTMTLKGRERVGGSDAFVVEATPAEGHATRLYFDTQTGLLVRKDRTYFEDYREVDGVKLPFRERDDFSVIRLTEVKHNPPVDDARFAEEKNCFTQ